MREISKATQAMHFAGHQLGVVRAHLHDTGDRVSIRTDHNWLMIGQRYHVVNGSVSRELDSRVIPLQVIATRRDVRVLDDTVQR